MGRNLTQNGFIGLIIVVFGLVSCSPKLTVPFSRTGEVEMIESEPSTITVVSRSYAETKAKAIAYAERNALENILYRGIPGSSQESPMIADEQAAQRSHGQILQRLILDGLYSQFVIQSYVDQSVPSGKGVSVGQVVKFDLNALRKYLEKEGVIRTFGL